MSRPQSPTARRRLERVLLVSLCVGALLGLAFTSGSEGALQRALGRSVGLPTVTGPDAADRQLGTPAEDGDVPVALAATATNAPSRPTPGDSGSATPNVNRVSGGETESVPATTSIPASAPDAEVSANADAGSNDEVSEVAAAATQPAASTPTTTAAPRTTTTTTAPQTTTTTAAPRTTTTSSAPVVEAPTVAPGGWVNPAATGHRRSNLHDFAPANDGAHGVTIDDDFLAEHAGAAWLTYEGDRPVISGMEARGRCLNIVTTITLRDSVVECPTRVQNGSWGYIGDVDDAPAINILGADDVLIEYNTITCSGFDGDICSRSVRAAGHDAVVQYNDLSLARGAVSLYHGTVFRFNYAHDMAFGFDPKRADNPDDNITHNNIVNNQGYNNALVHGNYIVARYGRVSAEPNRYRNPHYSNVYPDGLVSIGDPINGYAFTNYLINGDGDGMRITDNYVVGSGRPFLCSAGDRQSSPTCADDISGNVFADPLFEEFGWQVFRDHKRTGTISGSCNTTYIGGVYEVLPASIFGDENTHGTQGC